MQSSPAPASHHSSSPPTLWRILTHHTVDGYTTTSAGLAVIVYSGWLGLSAHTGNILTVSAAIATTLAAAVYAATVHYQHGRSTRHVVAVGAISTVLATAGVISPNIAVSILAAVGVIFYLRLIVDIHRSEHADGISAWTWVLYLAGNVAWLIETGGDGTWNVFALTALMMTLMAVTLAVTLHTHRRTRQPQPAPTTTLAP